MSQPLRLIVRAAAYTVVLTLIQSLASVVLVGVPLPTDPRLPLWALVGNALTASVLAGTDEAARIRGWRLAAGLAFGWLVVAAATSQLEAVAFQVLTPSQGLRLLLHSLLVAGGIAGGAMAMERVLRTSAELSRPVPGTNLGTQFLPGQWVARLLTCGGIYVVLYFTAGMLVMTQPAVREFYGQRQIPGFVQIVGLQLFVRGPAFAAVLALLSYLLGSERRRAALTGAAWMSIVGGAAALIVPNPFFPDAVRWAHFVEVVSSNLVFGAIAGWLMTPPRAEALAPRAAQLASSSR
jgi:hypothetical protein